MEKVIELIDAKNKTKKPKKQKIPKPRIGGKVPKNWIYWGLKIRNEPFFSDPQMFFSQIEEWVKLGPLAKFERFL